MDKPIPEAVIVLLNHLETLMDEGKLEEDAIPTDMWNAVSMHNFALAQQPAAGDEACRHSWHDYGQVNRSWCSKCNALAVTGYEDRPYALATQHQELTT